jgi:hypothetical protein
MYGRYGGGGALPVSIRGPRRFTRCAADAQSFPPQVRGWLAVRYSRAGPIDGRVARGITDAFSSAHRVRGLWYRDVAWECSKCRRCAIFGLTQQPSFCPRGSPGLDAALVHNVPPSLTDRFGRVIPPACVLPMGPHPVGCSSAWQAGGRLKSSRSDQLFQHSSDHGAAIA